MSSFRIHVTHDDGTDAEYEVVAVRAYTPIEIKVEHDQLVLVCGQLIGTSHE